MHDVLDYQTFQDLQMDVNCANPWSTKMAKGNPLTNCPLDLLVENA